MATQRFFIPAQDALRLIANAEIVQTFEVDANTIGALLNTGIEAEVDFTRVSSQLVRVQEARYSTSDGALALREGDLDVLVSTTTGDFDFAVSNFETILSNANDVYDVAAWQAADTIDVNVLGSFTADAGGGFDRLVFSQAREDVLLQPADGGQVRIGFDGESVLVRNLEQVRFSNCTVDIAPDGSLDDCGIGTGLSVEAAQTVALLFEAGLDRDGAIRLGGLNFWIDARENGMSEARLAEKFLVSPEFRQNFGEPFDTSDPDHLADRALVEVLFRNVLDRDGAERGIDFWTGAVGKASFTRADLLIAFAESPENVAGSPFIEDLTEVSAGEWAFA